MTDKMYMLNSILYMNSKLFVNCLEGVTKEIYLKCAAENVNNIAFIACHCLDARYYMAGLTGLELVNPYKEVLDKIKSPHQINEFPELADIISLWKEVSIEIDKRFAAITDEELGKEAPLQLPLTERTIGGNLAFFLQHESFHIGQIALLRKDFGLPAMRYV